MTTTCRIISEDLDSALIMEDDMDWDVRLKWQLEQIAKGARKIPKTAKDTPRNTKNPNSPYGDDWDLLWLGHCGEIFPEDTDEAKDSLDPAMVEKLRGSKYTILEDPTVPPPQDTTGFQDFAAHPYTRWVHVTGAPICTFAYALSRQGARKVLFGLSVDGLHGAFDNELAALCRRAVGNYSGDHNILEENGNNDYGLNSKCVSVTPPVFFHHKAKGHVSGDSDIQSVAEDQTREKGTTENIVWSARNNLKNMILNRPMESQF